MASGRKNLRYFMVGEEEEGNMVVHLTLILFLSFEVLVWQSPDKERIISDRKSGTFEDSGEKKSIYKIHLIHLESLFIQSTFIYSLNEA